MEWMIVLRRYCAGGHFCGRWVIEQLLPNNTFCFYLNDVIAQTYGKHIYGIVPEGTVCTRVHLDNDVVVLLKNEFGINIAMASTNGQFVVSPGAAGLEAKAVGAFALATTGVLSSGPILRKKYGGDVYVNFGVPEKMPRVTLGMLNKILKTRFAQQNNKTYIKKDKTVYILVNKLANGQERVVFQTESLSVMFNELILNKLVTREQIIYMNRPDQVTKYFRNPIKVDTIQDIFEALYMMADGQHRGQYLKYIPEEKRKIYEYFKETNSERFAYYMSMGKDYLGRR